MLVSLCKDGEWGATVWTPMGTTNSRVLATATLLLPGHPHSAGSNYQIGYCCCWRQPNGHAITCCTVGDRVREVMGQVARHSRNHSVWHGAFLKHSEMIYFLGTLGTPFTDKHDKAADLVGGFLLFSCDTSWKGEATCPLTTAPRWFFMPCNVQLAQWRAVGVNTRA